jgi:hypothetical protein
MQPLVSQGKKIPNPHGPKSWIFSLVFYCPEVFSYERFLIFYSLAWQTHTGLLNF